MKINLPTETMEGIIKSLEIKNQASTRFNGQDFHFKKERFSFDSGKASNFSTFLEKLDQKVEKVIRHEAESKNFTFATIGRVWQEENLESGKVVYIYFFSNDKSDTTFPDELVSQYELHTWTRMIK